MTFTPQENQLIEKGFKFNIQDKNSVRTLETLGVDTEISLRHVPSNISNKYEAAKIIKREFFKNIHNTNTSQIVKEIKTKSHNIIFTKADKGNTVVAIKRDEYISKTLQFLDPKQFKIIKRDPTELYQKFVNSIIINCKSLFNDRDLRLLSIMNPQAPKMYSLIKLHKTGLPIRPVVSFFSAPSYKVSKKLIDLIKNYTCFSSKFQIINSYDLVNKINYLRLPHNGKLLFFDVTNLFPSIPIKETITLVENLLSDNNTHPIIKQEIMDTLKVCLEQNYFEFNNDFYTSNEGLIMGNPLSPLLAEIFMNFLENKISQHSNFKYFLYWYRYVDDVIACFSGTDRQLNSFLEFINKLHPNIKFTIELESQNSINFLDLTVTREKDKHVFSVFRKPSHTDTVIHNSSCHPIQHKLAAFNSMIHRLISLPLNEQNFQIELNIIKQIALNNGYSPSLINNLLAKQQYKKTINLIYPSIKETNKNYNVITFVGQSSIKIKKYLNIHNVNVAFRTNNSLGKYIKNAKSKSEKTNKSGIYKLTCKDCPKIYIGQTGRSFGKRIKEHYSNFVNNKNSSNYANHLLESNHTFNPNFDILHIADKGHKLNNLESLEINKLRNSNLLLNDQLDLNSSPLLNLFC